MGAATQPQNAFRFGSYFSIPYFHSYPTFVFTEKEMAKGYNSSSSISRSSSDSSSSDDSGSGSGSDDDDDKNNNPPHHPIPRLVFTENDVVDEMPMGSVCLEHVAIAIRTPNRFSRVGTRISTLRDFNDNADEAVFMLAGFKRIG